MILGTNDEPRGPTGAQSDDYKVVRQNKAENGPFIKKELADEVSFVDTDL